MKLIILVLSVLALTAIALTVKAQSVLINGLIAYYPLNGTLNDFSTNGLNGSFYNYTGSGPYGPNQFGVPNGACFFDGTVNPVVLLPAQTINNLSSGTISTWLQLSNNTQEAIFAKQHDGASSYSVLSVGSYSSAGGPPTTGVPGQLYFHSQNGIADGVSSVILQTGVWYHVVVTFNTTNCNFYINGVPAGSTAGNFSIPNDLSGIVCSMGSWLSSGGVQYLSFQGGIDHFRIFNTALSSNSVAQLYAAELLGPPPQITQNLTNFSVVYGQSTLLSVAASSATPLSYQWYFLASNPQIAQGYAEAISGFVYGVIVTNSGSGYGNVPSVSFSGGGGTGAAGYATISNGVVTGITVTNAGTGYTNPPNVAISIPNGFLNGQTNSTFALNNVNSNNLGNYFVVLANNSGSTTSRVVSLTLEYPPTIINNPSGFNLSLHSSNSLSVAVSGTPPFAYQWMLNGTNLNNATNSVYVIPNLAIINAGNYTVMVTNLYGYAISAVATVELLPSLTAPFTGTVSLWGQNTVLSVGAVGSGVLNYQWYFNGEAISGANSSSYDLNSIQFTNAGLYSVVVSSSYGSVTNNAYQVTVNPANVSLGVFPGVIISGTVGYNYTIQGSIDLSNTNGWTTLTNLTLSEPVEIWSDYGTDVGSPSNPHKFYRVLPEQ